MGTQKGQRAERMNTYSRCRPTRKQDTLKFKQIIYLVNKAKIASPFGNEIYRQNSSGSARYDLSIIVKRSRRMYKVRTSKIRVQFEFNSEDGSTAVRLVIRQIIRSDSSSESTVA
ncbi:hypothetical protein LOAG_07190 [Loa loa]|uniref:MSP domain-containing protein n=1 Tax=Loa loa TaxID=7209 RepID=A0A1I7VTA5_LOALO|nr:hypothetical protein LOAG_07190 [Loa loa]EFO21296.1 hypothetical protein LOAG_07190 [Loa loa]